MKKVFSFLCQYRDILIYTLVLTLYGFIYIPEKQDINPWISTPYLLSYEFGFISRGFIGTIFKLLYPNLNIYTLYIIFILIIVTLGMMTILILQKVYRHDGSNSIFLVFVYCLLFLTNPGSIAYLFNQKNFVRFDAFLIIITYISLLITISNKRGYLVAILSIIGIMIHQSFLFLYFPFIILIFTHHTLVNSAKKREFIWIGLLIITVAIITYYLQFYGKIRGIELSDLVHLLQNQYQDIPISKLMIRREYFSSIREIFEVVSPKLVKLFFYLIIQVILLFPLIIIFCQIWKRIIINTSSNINKTIFRIMSLSFITMLPLFITTIDWGRWISSIIITQFLFIFYLILIREEAVLKTITGLYTKRNLAFLILSTIYLASFGKFNEICLPITIKLYQFFQSFLPIG